MVQDSNSKWNLPAPQRCQQTSLANEVCGVIAPNITVERGAPCCVMTGRWCIRKETLPHAVDLAFVAVLFYGEFSPPFTDDVLWFHCERCWPNVTLSRTIGRQFPAILLCIRLFLLMFLQKCTKAQCDGGVCVRGRTSQSLVNLPQVIQRQELLFFFSFGQAATCAAGVDDLRAVPRGDSFCNLKKLENTHTHKTFS